MKSSNGKKMINYETRWPTRFRTRRRRNADEIIIITLASPPSPPPGHVRFTVDWTVLMQPQ